MPEDNINTDDFAPATYPHPEMLYGPWVTVYRGLGQAEPPIEDTDAPPITGGYRYVDGPPERWEQREGFFNTAAVLYFDFDGKGGVTGYRENNRGGVGQHSRNASSGTYDVWVTFTPTGHRVYSGNIYTTFRRQDRLVYWNLYFVMTNLYEFKWLWIPPEPLPEDAAHPLRPLIASGTMRKIMQPGLLRRMFQRMVFG